MNDDASHLSCRVLYHFAPREEYEKLNKNFLFLWHPDTEEEEGRENPGPDVLRPQHLRGGASLLEMLLY